MYSIDSSGEHFPVVDPGLPVGITITTMLYQKT